MEKYHTRSIQPLGCIQFWYTCENVQAQLELQYIEQKWNARKRYKGIDEFTTNKSTLFHFFLLFLILVRFIWSLAHQPQLPRYSDFILAFLCLIHSNVVSSLSVHPFLRDFLSNAFPIYIRYSCFKVFHFGKIVHFSWERGECFPVYSSSLSSRFLVFNILFFGCRQFSLLCLLHHFEPKFFNLQSFDDSLFPFATIYIWTFGQHMNGIAKDKSVTWENPTNIYDT